MRKILKRGFIILEGTFRSGKAEGKNTYTSGYRNDCRLLYSNDGLIFVTYDHYLTFYEIGLEVVE